MGRLGPSPSALSLPDRYATSAPSVQNALDLFRGEWASKFPPPFEDVEAGGSLLFDDDRLRWGIAELGGVAGKRVLELGPLESGHTYMLERLGAESIVAVEANPRAYLKCLVSKEVLELRRARFLFGDFVAYLRASDVRFGVVVASGVLYHMAEPAELMALLSRASDRVYLWTHYYDRERIGRMAWLATTFSDGVPAEYHGFRHTLFRHQYAPRLTPRFFGGSQPFSSWMPRQDLLDGLRHFGFDDVRINFEEPEHPAGPCFALAAMRR
jgi:hypothetical protein